MKLAQEMGDRAPVHLYRYVPVSERNGEVSDRLRRYLEATIRGSTLHFSRAASFNDPFDGSFRFSWDADAKTKREFWAEAGAESGQPKATIEATIAAMLHLTPERERELNLLARHSVENHGVCCFTGTPDDLLAWAHYARSHTGICLRFRSVDLFAALATAPSMLLEVQYKEQHPIVPFYQEDMFERMLAIICTKGTAWAHEHEWRIVRPSGPGDVPFPASALDTVILGCRMSADDEAFVRATAAAAPSPIQVLKARIREWQYGLVIE